MKKLTIKIGSVCLALMLLTATFTALPFTAAAATPTESVGAKSGATGNCTWTLDDNGTLTISGNGEMEDYYSFSPSPWETDVKEVFIEKGVTSIGNCAFENCIGLTSVTIPDSVTSIGDFAFSDCAGLTSVVFPYSVTSISVGAFYGCTGLRNVTVGNNLTSIGFLAFYGCTGLTSFTVGNSVTSIGQYAFCGCTGLTSLSVAENNSFYDSRNNCNAIIETASNKLLFGCQNTVIPDSVTSIEENAFYGCTGLTSVIIPDSVTSIGEYAFENCAGLTSVVIPDSVTSIGDFALSGCVGLTSLSVADNNLVYDSRNNCNAVIETESNKLLSGCKNTVIPDSVTSIGDFAFYGCTGLTSITIPDRVKSIGESAFENCTGLTSVVIPKRVKSIGEYVFSGCVGLTSLSVAENNSVYDSRNNCNAIIETASNKLKIGCQNTVIPDSVKSIGSYAFYSCTGMTSVTIPNSVTSIGTGAFRDCTELTSVSIPDSVTSICDGAFNGCTGMTSVVIPDSVTDIGDFAFFRCTGMTSVTIPNSVKTIGERAFGYIVKQTKNDGFTIFGRKGSAANYYALNNGFAFVTLVIKGDVNGDGYVSINDVTLIQYSVVHMKSIPESQLDAADINGDGYVDVSDATLIQKYLAGIADPYGVNKP